MKKVDLAKLHEKLTYTALVSILAVGVLTLVVMILEKLLSSGPAWLGVLPYLISLSTTLATATGISSVLLSFYRISAK